MTIDVGKTIDAVSAIVKVIGDTATVAMQVGDVVLPILQDVGLLFPPSAVAANYVSVAMPYISEVAKYAPAVQQGLQTGKPLIVAAASVGDAVLSPTYWLLDAIPSLIEHETFAAFDAFFKANAYTPQDQRFLHGAPDA